MNSLLQQVFETRTAGPVILGPADHELAEQVARRVVSDGDGWVNSDAWVDAARDGYHDLPAVLRKALAEFRRDSGPGGAFLVRGLPVDESAVPDTPAYSGSVQKEGTVPAALLTLVASGLGDPAAFLAEKSGALVHDVVPVPGSEAFQGNEGSVMLSFHNENAFHAHRPDYVLLLCLRADHEKVAGLRVSCIRKALDKLSKECVEALFRPIYITSPPPSFGDAGQLTEPHGILTGAPDDPDLLVDFAATKPLGPDAVEAMRELQRTLAATADTIYLEPGDLAIVDNRVSVHGRTSFTPRYDGHDRWLQRTFSVRDLRASRSLRPNDSHVMIR
ncbi:L-asparagine oxygenase [Kribbella qitaiheensis]|uniref:L-asparagine oxygenase n=1 Tax=Kribbella qitaiheensis TaxID=1544730 RepID=A0A7G6X5M0_9ACTN|nr:TauD/TfdA family dioxygenase [Kribbella qitaiheensis]QNE21535.1 L-asparagine oxygenase [Kribbella qitaiheensis]